MSSRGYCTYMGRVYSYTIENSVMKLRKVPYSELEKLNIDENSLPNCLNIFIGRTEEELGYDTVHIDVPVRDIEKLFIDGDRIEIVTRSERTWKGSLLGEKLEGACLFNIPPIRTRISSGEIYALENSCLLVLSHWYGSSIQNLVFIKGRRV